MIGYTEVNYCESRINAHFMVETSSRTLAKECKRLYKDKKLFMVYKNIYHLHDKHYVDMIVIEIKVIRFKRNK